MFERIKHLDIQLINNDQAVYHPKQIICGFVSFTAVRPVPVKSISVKLIGNGEWRKRGVAGTSYTCQHNFIDRTIPLWPEKSLANNQFRRRSFLNRARDAAEFEVFQVKRYSYSFSITVPHDCHDSIEGSNGRIRYYLQASIDTIERMYTSRKVLTLIRIKDLNLTESLGESTSIVERQHVFFRLVANDLATFKVTVPKIGYAPGEVLKACLTICWSDANAHKLVKGLAWKLMQRLKFYSMSNLQKPVIDEVCGLSKTMLKCKGVCRNETEFTGNIVIPPCPSSSIGETMIRVEYFLEVKIVLCFGPLEMIPDRKCLMSVPLVIGTVPIRHKREGRHPIEYRRLEKTRLRYRSVDDDNFKVCEKFRPFSVFYNCDKDRKIHRPSIIQHL